MAIDAILATVLTLGSDIVYAIQFYRQYFAMKRATLRGRKSYSTALSLEE